MAEEKKLTYKFQAAEANGNIITDRMEAVSADEVVQEIRNRNLIPVKIEPEGVLDRDLSFNIKQSVKVSDLAVFCRQLSAMLSAGMPINRALDIQETQTTNTTLKAAVGTLSNGIKQGETLSKLMKEFPLVFPPILINMVESGESTGNLDDSLLRMSLHFNNENKINKQIKSAMMYPAILVVVMIIVLIVMMVFVLPQFAEMFAQNGAELPLITRMVMAVSNSFIKYWYIYAIVVGAAVAGWIHYKNTPNGRYNYDEAKLKMPVLGTPMRQIVTARFTRTLSTLLASGVSIVDALLIAGETTNNVLVIDAIAVATDGIKRGMSLTSELRKIEYFPLMMVSMVGIGEETGSLDSLLATTADYYDEELEQAIASLMSLIEPIMIIMLAGIVGTVVISIMLPMFEFSSGATIEM